MSKWPLGTNLWKREPNNAILTIYAETVVLGPKEQTFWAYLTDKKNYFEILRLIETGVIWNTGLYWSIGGMENSQFDCFYQILPEFEEYKVGMLTNFIYWAEYKHNNINLIV